MPLLAPKHCAYCGHPLPDERDAQERFGEPFCSEAHAEEFVAGVRAARMGAAARAETAPAPGGESRPGGCPMPPPGQRTWRDSVKRAACWSAPALVLLALPLISTGGWAAAGGSLLSVLALLACPIGMYFMMRTMGGMQHGGSRDPSSPRQPQTPPAVHEGGR
jgi:hypothetical protein